MLERPLIIPLGKTVEGALGILQKENKLDPRLCLWGFPHPSGANGHRHKQFANHLSSMKEVIKAVFLHL